MMGFTAALSFGPGAEEVSGITGRVPALCTGKPLTAHVNLLKRKRNDCHRAAVLTSQASQAHCPDGPDLQDAGHCPCE